MNPELKTMKEKRQVAGTNDKFSVNLKRRQEAAKVKNGLMTKKATKITTSKKDDCIPCASCSHLVNDPDFADFPWVQCTLCKKWFHDKCDDVCNMTGICTECQKQ